MAATPTLARAVDFVPLRAQIHRRASGQGAARLDALKGRVLITDRHRAGLDPGAESIAARPITLDPRPSGAGA